MSAKIETLVICDGPDCGTVYADGDQRYKTAAQQRSSYVEDGWHFAAGKDFCPKCVASAQSDRTARRAARRVVSGWAKP